VALNDTGADKQQIMITPVRFAARRAAALLHNHPPSNEMLHHRWHIPHFYFAAKIKKY
jgi:hypothetical protein